MSWVFTDEMRFYLHEGETLLDGMIRTQHKDVRYMCRQGYCGACKMKVKGMIGQVSSKQTPLAQLHADEVLACCCMPMGAMAVGYEGGLQGIFVKDCPSSCCNAQSVSILCGNAHK